MLLNHARSTGASVYEQTRVESVAFSPADPSAPVSIKWIHTPPPPPLSPPASPTRFRFSSLLPSSVSKSGPTVSAPAPIEGVTTFDYLIDATGRSGILSTRYFKDRHYNASLKNIAIWGYWRNVGVYGNGTPRHGAPWFEALTGKFNLFCSYRHGALMKELSCRRIWMGMVHSLARWNHIDWYCHERKGVPDQESSQSTVATTFAHFALRISDRLGVGTPLPVQSFLCAWCTQADHRARAISI